MTGRVKGDTVNRIWSTFQARGHAEEVGREIDPSLRALLDGNELLANEWYPIEHYLALYGVLGRLKGHAEVVATARESVTTGLRRGSWRVFLPLLAGLAPESFCQRGIKRFEMVYKLTFVPGESAVSNRGTGGADVDITGVPWATEPAWRGGVTGGLLAVPGSAGLEGECQVHDTGERAVRFELRWRR
jgi:hypothetical protein